LQDLVDEAKNQVNHVGKKNASGFAITKEELSKLFEAAAALSEGMHVIKLLSSNVQLVRALFLIILIHVNYRSPTFYNWRGTRSTDTNF
jgi:hypothetical protein